MDIEVPFGPATVTVQAMTLTKQDKLDSAAPASEHDEAILSLYSPKNICNVRVRCEFKRDTPDATRKAVADEVIDRVTTAVGKLSYPYTREGRLSDFDMEAVQNLSKQDAQVRGMAALEAVLAARDAFWQSDAGMQYADKSRQLLARILTDQAPTLDVTKRAKAEQVIADALPKAERKVAEIRDPEKKRQGLAFHLSEDKAVVSSLGSMGINAQMSRKIFNDVSHVLKA